MGGRDHWEAVYRAKRPDEVSWFQPRAELSRELIRGVLAEHDAWVVDVGGGASTLASGLVEEGYRNLLVFDLASAALVAAREGDTGTVPIRRIVADALVVPLADESVAVWHDRAVFHFLTDPADRARYVAEVRRCVRPGGFVVMATFAADGPTRCSGLPVARYDPDELHGVFDGDFELITSRREVHRTPGGASQPYTYCLCRYSPEPTSRAAA